MVLHCIQGICALLLMLLCTTASADVVFSNPPVVLEDDALHPQAFNATYRGTWRSVPPHHHDSSIARLLDQEEGVAVYVLKVLHTTDGVSDVEVRHHSSAPHTPPPITPSGGGGAP